MRLLLVQRCRYLNKIVLMLQASLSMAVLIEGLLFAFHLQVGCDLSLVAAAHLYGQSDTVWAERHGSRWHQSIAA